LQNEILDGGHTIRSFISENSIFIDTELLPIEVLHCGNREFRDFFAKNSGNYFKKFLRTQKSA